MRGGTSPEVWRTTFEHATDGATWTNIGTGTRIPGGWELRDITLPATGTLRARGHIPGGASGSGWFVESILSLTPNIQLNLARNGTTAVLSWTGGHGPYQVQQTTDLNQPNSWQDVGDPLQMNSTSLPIAPGTSFLRVRGQ
jgi:hypothetical protein